MTQTATHAFIEARTQALAAHVGEWVILRGTAVVASASTPEEVTAWWRDNGHARDAMLFVPAQSLGDDGGFAGPIA